MNKAQLRKIYLARQKKFSTVERNEKSLAIAERFFRFFNLTEIEFLHCFVPIEKYNEIKTPLIFKKSGANFQTLKRSFRASIFKPAKSKISNTRPPPNSL